MQHLAATVPKLAWNVGHPHCNTWSCEGECLRMHCNDSDQYSRITTIKKMVSLLFKNENNSFHHIVNYAST